jgi:hypothetical protein
MLAKKTSKNQLTLPKDVVKSFPDVDYFDVAVKENRIVLTPVKMAPVEASLDAVREKMKALGVTESDVDKAVKWARKRSR